MKTNGEGMSRTYLYAHSVKNCLMLYIYIYMLYICYIYIYMLYNIYIYILYNICLCKRHCHLLCRVYKKCFSLPFHSSVFHSKIHRHPAWKAFEKPRLHFQIFPNSLKSVKIEIFARCLHIWSNEEGGLSVRWHVASEESSNLWLN